MKPKPMLVTAGPLRPDSDRYAFEVKWDGFRALIEAAPSGIKVWSRNGHDMTSRYPELQGLASAVTTSVVLDGEIVCLDDKGHPDFAALWFRSRGSSSPAVCFMAFDVLEVDGRATIDEPYRERRDILEDLELSGPHWCTPEIHIGEGAALFDATKQMGLEGVVAKRLDSRYRPGLRSKSWSKTKHFQTRNFALLGWLPPEEWREDRGCVVLGLRSEAGIAVAGVVEWGYGRDVVEQLRLNGTVAGGPYLGASPSKNGLALAIAPFWGRLLGWSLGSNPRTRPVSCRLASVGVAAESRLPSAPSLLLVMTRSPSQPSYCLSTEGSPNSLFVTVSVPTEGMHGQSWSVGGRKADDPDESAG